MRSKSRSIRAVLTIVAALLITGTVWQVRRARAVTAQADPPFGMVGITRGQTIRLSVADLARLNSDGSLPPPCRVVLTFRDANGRPFTNSDGQVIRREVELQVGHSAFLDLNGDNFVGPPTTNDATGPLRLQLRPFVRVLVTPPDPEIPPPCRATMEIFDNASGRTSIFAQGFNQPPEPD